MDQLLIAARLNAAWWAADDLYADSTEMVGPMARVRLELMRSTPAVRGRALQLQLDSLAVIADRLHEAYADELTPVEAAATVGAFVGAVSASLQMLLAEEGALDDPATLQRRMLEATTRALSPAPRP